MSTAQLQRFDKFWTAYPRKMSKGYAKKIWLKLAPGEKLLQKMLKNIEEGKKSEEWKNPKFSPFPSTYLNSEGWENQYTPARKSLNLDVLGEK